MIKKLLPLFLAVIGLGAGIGGGLMLRPEPQEVVEINPCGDVPATDAAHDPHAATHEPGEEDPEHTTFEYVKLNNQFVIPDLEAGRVVSMVVLSLSLEARTGSRESIYAREPKLRDVLLQVMFDHANSGGFKDDFTDSVTMNALRHALLEAAQATLGPEINDVLVIDIVRQDMS